MVDFQNSQNNYYLFWKQDTLQKAEDRETSQSKLTSVNQHIKGTEKLYIYLIPHFIYQCSNTEFNKHREAKLHLNYKKAVLRDSD